MSRYGRRQRQPPETQLCHVVIRITPKAMYEFLLEKSWIQNQGAPCTSACVVAALGALGGKHLPDLATASTILAGRPNGPPGLLDYVTLPFRRAPLDLRIEDLAVAHGVRLSSRSEVVLPGLRARPGDGEG